MLGKITPLTTQIEADKRLVRYSSYEHYLNSILTNIDRCYLQSPSVSYRVAEMGYRSTAGMTIPRHEFERRIAAVKNYLWPSFKPYIMASEGIVPKDNLFIELAIRETLNRLGILSTIIYLRQTTRTGVEISGYIDYQHRLTSENWKPLFLGQKRLWPRPSDLGFYDWKCHKAKSNDSPNYKVLIDSNKGLLFQNRFDRKIICVDPARRPGDGSVRIRIKCDAYEHVVLYDHFVVQRI